MVPAALLRRSTLAAPGGYRVPIPVLRVASRLWTGPGGAGQRGEGQGRGLSSFAQRGSSCSPSPRPAQPTAAGTAMHGTAMSEARRGRSVPRVTLSFSLSISCSPGPTARRCLPHGAPKGRSELYLCPARRVAYLPPAPAVAAVLQLGCTARLRRKWNDPVRQRGKGKGGRWPRRTYRVKSPSSLPPRSLRVLLCVGMR